jgi:hypothetical protein
VARTGPLRSTWDALERADDDADDAEDAAVAADDEDDDDDEGDDGRRRDGEAGHGGEDRDGGGSPHRLHRDAGGGAVAAACVHRAGFNVFTVWPAELAAMQRSLPTLPSLRAPWGGGGVAAALAAAEAAPAFLAAADALAGAKLRRVRAALAAGRR